MPNEKVNLLLVDDNRANLLALSSLLENPEYALLFADSGKEALAHLKQHDISLVLLDVMMPVMDGFEVAQAMKQDSHTRDIPIIFVTAIAKEAKDIYRGYSLGAVDYIQKPLDPDLVRARVSIFVELFRKNREIQRQAELIRNSERAESLERETRARLQAESAERRFRSLVHSLDHAIIWESDPAIMKFTFVSERAEALLGYPAEQWLNEADFFISHVHPDDRIVVLNTLKNALHGVSPEGLGERCEHRFVTTAGRERWFHSGFQAEYDQHGKATRIRGLSVDIDPLKGLERTLRDAIRAREEIVAFVAHDLKNPITVIDLTSDILLRHSKGRDELVTQQAERIRRSSARALTIVQDILDVAKLEYGKFFVKTRPESMKELFADASDMMQPSVEMKKIQLSSELPSEDAQVICDRGRILQVLANLLENAVRYTPENGSIVLKGSLEGDRARITVADSGVGIAEAKIQHLFERFWQADSMNTGTGLGLYIANEIMKSHGSEISVESTLGHGSSFSFSLHLHTGLNKGNHAAIAVAPPANA